MQLIGLMIVGFLVYGFADIVYQILGLIFH